jgi:hypothetical protein
LLAGRGVGAAYNLGKGLVQPFFQSGQRAIASRLLQSFAGSPQDAQAVAGRLANPPSILPGVQPTTAELANSGGIAQLERSSRNLPGLTTDFTARDQANQGAMTQALRNIGGTPQDLASAVNARSLATAPLYKSAAQAIVPADATLGSLLSRPVMGKAWDRAEELAANNGESLAQPSANDVSGKTLQYLKMALTDMRETAEQKGIGAHEQSALDSTISDFNAWSQSKVPQLAAADRAYATLSRPINQMQIGQKLSDRLVPALGDYGANSALTPGNYANALRNGDATAVQATGFPTATLQNTLSPAQMTSVNQVAEQLARRQNAQNLGRAVGSNTAQNLVGANLIQQVLGPLGLPNNWATRAAQSALARGTIGRAASWAGKAGEEDIQNLLGRAMLDPATARKLLANPATSKMAQALLARQGLLSPLLTGPVMGLLGSGSNVAQ